MNNPENLYLEGEEKFGFFTSRMYNFAGMSKTIRNFYDFVLKDVSKREFQSILDIGSGTGKILNSIVSNRQEIRAMGIDPSPHMIKVSRKNTSKQGNNITFENGSSRSIPGDKNFDLIISTMSFHHWKDRESAVKNIMKRLSQNGSFVIYEASSDDTFAKKMVKPHLMSRKNFEEIAQNLGIHARIMEDSGNILCEFKAPEKTNDSIS